MDLFIDRDELSRALARVQGIVERRSTHPVLSHVLLHARGEGVRMTATDTEVAYIGELAATIQKPGELAVDANQLFQIVRSLPDNTVQFTSGASHRLEIRSGRSFFRLPGIAADEYPPLPAFDARGTAKMKVGDVRRLVDQTSFAVATDDSRYGLNGAHLEVAGTSVRMVATDGHRLAAAEAPFEGALAMTPRMLVPRKALSVMKKILEGQDELVELSFGDGAVRLTRPGHAFWFRLLDGEFPDYRAVLPAAHKHRVGIRREDLSSALRRVAIVVQDKTRSVRFAFTESEVEIALQNTERGDVNETVPCELEGEPIAIGFNIRYLLDIIGAMGGGHVVLEMAHPLGPCMVKDPDDAACFFVIMPMRLD